MDNINEKKLIKKGISEEEIKKYANKPLFKINLSPQLSALVLSMDDEQYVGITFDNSGGADLSEPRYVVGKKIGGFLVIYLLDQFVPLQDYIHNNDYERYIIDGGVCIQRSNSEQNEVMVMNMECGVNSMSLDTNVLISVIQTSNAFANSKVLADVISDMESLSTPLPDESGALNIHDVIAKDKESVNHHLV